MKSQLERESESALWKVKRDTPLARATISILHTAWGSTGDYFPGPQPISIERKHFGILKNNYVVCEKSDGVRHVLMAYMYEGKKMCVIINRAFDIFLVPISLPKPAYQGTILDGELMTNLFLVYDAVAINGTSIANMNLFERLTAADSVVSKILKLATDPVLVKIKTFFGMNAFVEFQSKYLPTLNYKVDGLIFTPVNEPIRIGTHETMFKWKPRELNTIDFKAKKTGNKWSLYVQEKGTMVFESELKLEEAPAWMTDGCIVECQYMEERWWKPVGLRVDKVHPNNRRTFYNTLKNIKENIQWGEFCPST